MAVGGVGTAAWAQTPLWPLGLLALLVCPGRPDSDLLGRMLELRVTTARLGKLRLRERPGLARGPTASFGGARLKTKASVFSPRLYPTPSPPPC